MNKIDMSHGSGGQATKELIDGIFAKEFDNEYLRKMEDSSVLPVTSKVAFTTDSFVVTPLEFNGGDIGRLAVCGTVNDLLMRGSTPKYLSCGFILEEGLDTALLERTVHSLAETAREAGVLVVTGDTKVIEGNGGLIINTSGIGIFEHDKDISSANARVGDKVIVSGLLGEHHLAILAHRLDIKTDVSSDVAPLTDIVKNMLDADIDIHAMRDITRGGLATVLTELSQACGNDILIEESTLPVSEEVRSLSELLGLDPLYMGNEGKLTAIVRPEDAERALNIIRASKYGKNAAIVGEVTEGNGKALLKTPIGGIRELRALRGEGLPRIC